MSLQNLLDPDVIVPVLAGAILLHRIDSCNYNLFKDKLSFSKERFKDVQPWEEYLNQTSGKEFSEGIKQYLIKIYSSFVDKTVPKSLLFSRPFFYFQAKKEISYMKEESEKRLSELKAA